MARQALLLGIASIALFGSPLNSQATPTIKVDVPDFIAANSGSLIFPITVQGEPGDVYHAADLYLHLTGTSTPPTITNVDMIGSGTIFHGNNFGQFGYGFEYDPPGLETATLVTTESGFVGPNGVLAYITFDTTGLVPGNWYTLALTHPNLGPTVLQGLTGSEAFLVDGLFFVPVPEPSTCVLAAFGAAALCVTGYRKRASQFRRR